jgi:hypothetical protein
MTAMALNDNPATMHQLTLPPVFRAVTVRDAAFASARALAVAGGEAGTLVVTADAAEPSPPLLELAVVLEPDRPAADCFAALPIAMLAMADALSALGPPLKTVGFVWPDRLVLDGAEVGRARLALPAPHDEPFDQPLPAWLVVGLELRLRLDSDAAEPGRTPDRTALVEEGFGEVTAPEIVEAFARHLLHWVSRWQEEGLAPATQHYRARLVEPASASVRVDPLTFDLVRVGPPPSRESLAERLLLGPSS